MIRIDDISFGGVKSDLIGRPNEPARKFPWLGIYRKYGLVVLFRDSGDGVILHAVNPLYEIEARIIGADMTLFEHLRDQITLKNKNKVSSYYDEKG